MFFKKKKRRVSKGYLVLRKKKTANDNKIDELDKAWADEVKRRDGYRCRKCGGGVVSAHHIFTRSNHSVRWYVPNGVALDRGCHRFFAHMRPVEFMEWIKSIRGPGWWADLVAKKNLRHQPIPDTIQG